MSLVALAHLYVMQLPRDLKRKPLEPTSDMPTRLLQVILPHPQFALHDTGDLGDYYLERHKHATESHRKTWLAKAPNVVPRR